MYTCNYILLYDNGNAPVFTNGTPNESTLFCIFAALCFQASAASLEFNLIV